jgi:hypothetical protein
MSDTSKKLTETVSTAAMTGMGPVVLPSHGTLGSGDVPAGSGDAEEEYKKKKRRMKHLKTLESFISEGVNLKQSHLSSEDYQKAKKLKGFDEADWEWNGDKGLYSKVNESSVDKTSDQDRIYYDFLLTLRDSGKTNMFGAAPYLQKEFDLSKSEARKVLAEWMKRFNESVNEDANYNAIEKWVKKNKEYSMDTKGEMITVSNSDEFWEYSMADAESVKDFLKSITESKVSEAKEAQKPRGIDQFAEDMESDKMNPEIHLATFSGKSFKAQSTDKTWEDGVPVTKNFTRGGYKPTSPKGEHYIIETDKFWYFVIGRMWFAVKRADYGTPPFEY